MYMLVRIKLYLGYGSEYSPTHYIALLHREPLSETDDSLWTMTPPRALTHPSLWADNTVCVPLERYRDLQEVMLIIH